MVVFIICMLALEGGIYIRCVLFMKNLRLEDRLLILRLPLSLLISSVADLVPDMPEQEPLM